MEEEQKPKKENKNQKVFYGVITAIIVLILIVVAAIFVMNQNKEKDDNAISYTDLIKQMDSGKIEKVEMTVGSTSIKVKLKEEEKEKKSIVPNTQAFVELVQEKTLQGNEIELIQKEQNIFLVLMQYFFSLLPTILIVVLFIFLMKMQGLGDKGKVYDAETTKSKVKFDDVAGLEEEKSEMLEIVDFLKQPKKFYEMGAKIPRGVLLCGNLSVFEPGQAGLYGSHYQKCQEQQNGPEGHYKNRMLSGLY